MPKNQNPIALYLTKEEQKVFGALPEKLRTNVRVEDEKLSFIDSEESRMDRMRAMTVKHKDLQKIREQAATRKFTQADVEELSRTLDLSDLDQDDFLELAFAWGPEVFSWMIGFGLPASQSPDDLREIAELSTIRHGLLLSLTKPLP